jgi:deoxyribodipyrimidine photo-lyase
MTSFRRTEWNFSLQRAVEWSRELNKPLLVFEALRCGHRWASDRLHAFVLQGMADNAARLAKTPVGYYPYVEPEEGRGKGLLAALAGRACVVVGDDFPCFFLPRMQFAAAGQMSTRFELVDSNGLMPLHATSKIFLRAFDFRRYLQKQLRPHLEEFPASDPLRRAGLPPLSGPPDDVLRQWPAAQPAKVLKDSQRFCRIPIDHSVIETATRGGPVAARQTLRKFLDQRIDRYEDRRNQPQEQVTSGLSPYLHFGHISAHQAFHETMQRDGWALDDIAGHATGSAKEWWGANPAVESFLDELITWREVGYNMCAHRADYDQYGSLPDWAQATLARHARDPRPHVYQLEQFEAAETHDDLWNAAQRQLVREGRIHNYLRMLWGKKILHWSASPQDALETMIELNNKYALDGRNPNSYSGIFWVLGRYDRAWGPERPIFGKIRYMTSENTARKVNVKQYLQQYGPDRP